MLTDREIEQLAHELFVAYAQTRQRGGDTWQGIAEELARKGWRAPLGRAL